MWLSQKDHERLVTQAAQSEFLTKALEAATKRAEQSEKDLASERASKDWMISQLTSRFLTKQKSYGLDDKKPEPPPPNPKGYTHEPTVIELAKLEYYKQCYRDAGMPEEKGELRWEAEMRGEVVPFEFEMETEQ